MTTITMSLNFVAAVRMIFPFVQSFVFQILMPDVLEFLVLRNNVVHRVVVRGPLLPCRVVVVAAAADRYDVVIVDVFVVYDYGAQCYH